MLRVGLTGGIVCGKSRVLRRLAERGCATLNLDLVARELLVPGRAAHAEVVAAFCQELLAEDGAIDRKALAAKDFADAEERARLNAIVHPECGRRSGAGCRRSKRGPTPSRWWTPRFWSKPGCTRASTGWWWCTARRRSSSRG